MRQSLIPARAKSCLIALSALALVTRPGLTQVPSLLAPYAVIEGVAIDSLHHDYLRAALISVDGVSRLTSTDSLGKFRIDSVPPGSRRVRVEHAFLDTVGISLQTPLVELSPGQHVHLVLAVPSVQTLVAARCTEGERRVGPAALLGLVQFAESEGPAEGSQVILEFTNIKVVGKTVQSTPFRRTATVTASGRFKICGLPDDVSGSLIAVNGGDSTTWVSIHLNSRVGIVGLELPDPLPSPPSTPGAAMTASASARKGSAVLTGRVLDPTGVALPRVRVAVSGDSAVTFTDNDGRFALRNLRSGTRAVSVRRLGFEPADIAVTLHSRSPADLTVRLGQFVPVLDTVRVVARQESGLSRVGFSRRKQVGMGYYMSPDQISQTRAYDLPSLLAMAPMLRSENSGGRGRITGRATGMGGGCVTWWVDGDQWLGGNIEDFIRPDEIAAVEAYSSGFTPAEFQRAFTTCETVVIWTKQRVH